MTEESEVPPVRAPGIRRAAAPALPPPPPPPCLGRVSYSQPSVPQGAGDHCYYHGKLRGNPQSFAALSTCQGLQ